LEAAQRHQITHAFVVPTMLARILEAVGEDPHVALPSLRSLAYGGARMPLPVLERALEVFPDVDFVNAYGLTETSSTIAVLGPQEHRAARRGGAEAVERLRSVGQVVPGVEVEVVDASGASVSARVEGRIRIRGAQVNGGYLGEESPPEEGSWLITGDVGWLDEAGYLYIAGRADDTVIRGGENIAPAEVEDALLRHPSVLQAAVVGVPDDEWGERLAAAVVVRTPADPPTAAELRDHVRALLGTLKCPDLVTVVDDLPLTASGKVLRRDVRRSFLGGHVGSEAQL
jgi:acyl-CoA synthetase (AMP-forming)/AMP-acid ligase II